MEVSASGGAPAPVVADPAAAAVGKDEAALADDVPVPSPPPPPPAPTAVEVVPAAVVEEQPKVVVPAAAAAAADGAWWSEVRMPLSSLSCDDLLPSPVANLHVCVSSAAGELRVGRRSVVGRRGTQRVGTVAVEDGVRGGSAGAGSDAPGPRGEEGDVGYRSELMHLRGRQESIYPHAGGHGFLPMEASFSTRRA
jgi:hypothetical protein